MIIKPRHRDHEGNRFYTCPICHTGDIKVSHNVFYGKCNRCSVTLVDYVPLQHQEAFHQSPAQFRMAIGGFGSGKTTAASAEIAKHALSVKDGRSLITAPILSQVKDAVVPELLKFIPPWHIQKYVKSPNPYFLLKNGHEIVIYASNDQQKLRSLNLTAFYIEEASGVEYEIFDQLTTRLRNRAAAVYDKDGKIIDYNFLGIVSTNAEYGWIRDNFLLISSRIIGSKSIDTKMYDNLIQGRGEKHYHTFISSTRDNNNLPPDFIDRVTAGKTPSWIRKYIDCHLDVKEGAVYPELIKHMVEPFAIPRDWKRVIGFDPGYNDPTAMVFAAISPNDGKIYIYDEYKVPEQPVGYHAEELRLRLRDIPLAYPIQADPSVKKRSDRDGVSYADYFKRSYDIFLEPADNDLLSGIERVRDYFYQGKLKLFNNLLELKNEGTSYAYKEGKLNSNDKPIDKDNHLMDAMRYLIMRLPKDPNKTLEIYHKTNWFGDGKALTVSPFSGDANKPQVKRGSTVLGGMKL